MSGSPAFEMTKGKPYAETFRCPGGDVCLDFCNSGQGLRGSHRTEWITGYEDLIDWLVAAGSMPEEQGLRLRKLASDTPELAASVWIRAMRLREALFRVIHAVAQDIGTGAPEDLRLLESEHAATLSLACLSRIGERYAWSLDPSSTSLHAALQPVVQAGLRLLTSESLIRVRRCGSPTCFWLFVDETKNRSRRWCEMASCGNLAKVRRHREKARKQAGHLCHAVPEGDPQTRQ